MKRTTIKCPKCKGEGAVGLSDPLLEVLNIVTKFNQVGTTATMCFTGISSWPNHGITAFNNRLERLLNMGLLKRKRYGRQWIYFTKTK